MEGSKNKSNQVNKKQGSIDKVNRGYKRIKDKLENKTLITKRKKTARVPQKWRSREGGGRPMGGGEAAPRSTLTAGPGTATEDDGTARESDRKPEAAD